MSHVCVFVCLSLCRTVCLPVCWLDEYAVQTRLNRSRCRLVAVSYVGPRKHVLNGGQLKIRRIHLQPRPAMGDKSAMRPFAKLLWTVATAYRVT